MAEVEDYVNYISPVKGSKDALLKTDPDVAEQPADLPAARRAGPVARVPRPDGRGGDEVQPGSSRRSSEPDWRSTDDRARPTAGGDLRLRSAHQALRQLHRGRRPRPDDPAGLVLRAARPVGLRQDDDAAHGRRARAADRRRVSHRRPGRHRRQALPAAGQHGVPELRAVPAPGHLRERRVRPAPSRHARTSSGRGGGRSSWCSWRTWPAASPASSPAASSSASPWPGRSSTGRRCCCSTSRSARSTSSCAGRCRSSSSGSRPRSASRSCTSRTTRRRP